MDSRQFNLFRTMKNREPRSGGVPGKGNTNVPYGARGAPYRTICRNITPTRRSFCCCSSPSGRTTRSRTEQVSAADPNAIR